MRATKVPARVARLPTDLQRFDMLSDSLRLYQTPLDIHEHQRYWQQRWQQSQRPRRSQRTVNRRRIIPTRQTAHGAPLEQALSALETANATQSRLHCRCAFLPGGPQVAQRTAESVQYLLLYSWCAKMHTEEVFAGDSKLSAGDSGWTVLPGEL